MLIKLHQQEGDDQLLKASGQGLTIPPDILRQIFPHDTEEYVAVVEPFPPRVVLYTKDTFNEIKEQEEKRLRQLESAAEADYQFRQQQEKKRKEQEEKILQEELKRDEERKLKEESERRRIEQLKKSKKGRLQLIEEEWRSTLPNTKK